MKKTPFYHENDKFKIKPRITSHENENVVARRLLHAYIGYWGTFLVWAIVSTYVIPMIFTLGAIMWWSGGIAAWKIPPERGNIGRKTRFTMLSYVVGLLAFKFVSGIIVNTPVEMWEKVFMTDLPPAFTTTVMGFITMAFIVGMFMGFIAYLNYIFQLFMFHRAEKQTNEYINTLTRREENNQ